MAGFKYEGRSFVCGTSGNGKTSLIVEMIRPAVRLVIWDTLGEYHKYLPNVKTVRTLPDVAKAIYQRRGYAVAFHPPEGADTVRLFNELAALLFRLQTPYQQTDGQRGGRVVLVVEEADTAFPNQTLKSEYSYILSLARRGRHFGIDIIWSTQRPAQINKTARGNLDFVAVFYHSDEDDQIAAGKYLGTGQDGKGKRAVDIATLPRFEYFARKERQIYNSKTKQI